MVVFSHVDIAEKESTRLSIPTVRTLELFRLLTFRVFLFGFHHWSFCKG